MIAKKNAPKGLPLRHALIASAIVACHLPTAMAQIATGWTGTNSGLWNDPLNWDNTGPGAGARDLFFGNAWVTAGGTGTTTAQNDVVAWTGHKIVFESNASTPAFTITGNGFQLFDFGGASPVYPQIANLSNATQTFNLTTGSIQINDTSGSAKAEVLASGGGDLVFSSTTPVDLAGTTQLQFNSTAGRTITFNGTISSSGNSGNNTVAINGVNNVVFAAANTYAGDTFVNGGTLQFAAGGTSNSSIIRLGDNTGSSAATISLSTTAGGQTNSSGLNVRSGSSGAKVFVSQNTSGTNTWSGSGTLNADLTVTTNGGTLAFTGTTFDLNAQTLTVNGTGTTTISNAITNTVAGGRVVMGGSGVLVLGGATASTYTGLTTINSGGTIKLGKATGLGATTGATTVSAGGVLDLNGQTVGTEAVTLNGSGISSGGALINSNTVTAGSLGGAVTLASSSSIGGAGSLTLGGVVSGSTMVITKVGAGTLTLLASNTFTGGITINSGVLSYDGEATATSGAATPTGAIPASPVANFITLNGGVLQSTRLGSGVTFLATNKGITLAAGGGTLAVTDPGAGSLNIYQGVVAGSAGGAFNKAGVGVLSLTAVQTYDGATNVQAGTLRVRTVGERFPDASALTIASAGTFDVGGLTETMGSIAGAGTLALGAGAGTFGGNDSSTIYSGQVTGTSASSFNKVGAGTLTIQGNDWANLGGVNIRVGAIKFGNSAAGFSSSSTLTISSGAFLDMNSINDTFGALAGGGNIVNGANVTLASNNTSSYSGNYTGSGKLVKNGTAALTLTGTNGFTSVDFNDGRINVNNSGALGTGVINVAATADEFVSQVVGISLSNDMVLATGAAPKLYATSGFSIALNGKISGSGGFLRDDTGAGTITLAGDNSFGGGLMVTSRGGLFLGHKNALGAGVFTLGDSVTSPATAIIIQSNTNLTGTNALPATVTMNQAFTIAGSTGIEFSGPITLGTGNVTITTTNSGTTILSGTIGGTNGFTKAGTGGLAILGAKTYSGQVILSSGTLTVDSIANTGSDSSLGRTATVLSISTAAAGTLEYVGTSNAATNRGLTLDNTRGGNVRVTSSSNSLEFTGAITGTGPFGKYGAGTLLVTGAKAYTGAVTIAEGTLRTDSLANTSTTSGLGTGAAASSATVTIGSGSAGGLTYTGANVSTNRPIAVGTAANSSGTIESTTNTLTLTGGVFNNGKPITFDGAGNVTVSTTGISGAGAVTKKGAGILTLTASNSYSGITTISGGTVTLSGAFTNNIASSTRIIVGGSSAESTAALDVTGLTSNTLALAASQTLAGHGNVFGNVSANAGGSMITPGNSAGTLSIGGDLTISGGILSTTEFEFIGTDIVPVEITDTGTKFDFLSVSGALTLGGSRLNIVVPGGADSIRYNTAYVIATAGSVSSVFGKLNDQVVSTQYRGSYPHYDVNVTATSIEITFVPEPTSLSLLVGAGALAMRRRRRD